MWRNYCAYRDADNGELGSEWGELWLEIVMTKLGRVKSKMGRNVFRDADNELTAFSPVMDIFQPFSDVYSFLYGVFVTERRSQHQRREDQVQHNTTIHIPVYIPALSVRTYTCRYIHVHVVPIHLTSDSVGPRFIYYFIHCITMQSKYYQCDGLARSYWVLPPPLIEVIT